MSFFVVMLRRPPSSTRTDTRCPSRSLFRSETELFGKLLEPRHRLARRLREAGQLLLRALFGIIAELGERQHRQGDRREPGFEHVELRGGQADARTRRLLGRELLRVEPRRQRLAADPYRAVWGTHAEV